ncbi:MAG: hypothetical protein GYB65_12705, partial [Chloroflexi bacterium]|nr:hypothetical protein [Chloroflexota bacterium]
MSDTLAATFESTILAHRPLHIDAPWADEVVFPYYDGLSIRNLAHTVMHLVNSRPPTGRLGTAPLDGRLWHHLQGQVQRVVLFISDGLGWRLLQQVMAEDAETAQVVADLTGDGTLTPITSIAPSTTAVALPSIWTGASPSATGMVGTRLMLREMGMLVSMLFYRPLFGKHRAEVLEDWGMDLDNFMPVKTLGEELSTRRVPTHLLLQKDLYGSGLSRIMHRGVNGLARHFGYTDLWVGLRDLLRETRRKRCFVNIYWSGVDAISHLHGTTTEQTITEIRRELVDLRAALLEDGVGDGQTLFMFTADHGHVPVPNYINLAHHTPLMETLRCGLGGEGRFSYAYLRHDHRQAAIDYVQSHFADQVAAVLPDEAL